MYKISSKYPWVESVFCYLLNCFCRRVTERLGVCRGFNVLSKPSGMREKELLHGNDEVPEKGEPGSEVQPVGTHGGLWAEDPQPGIHTCKRNLAAALLCHPPEHRPCSPASQSCSVLSEWSNCTAMPYPFPGF